MASNSVLDERTLRELYLTSFEIAVKEGRPKCIMTSYNRVNGTYANENHHLLQDILHGEWGYDGAVVTDWGGSNDHVEGVREGSTLEMPCPGFGSAKRLMQAVGRAVCRNPRWMPGWTSCWSWCSPPMRQSRPHRSGSTGTPIMRWPAVPPPKAWCC